MFTQSNLTRGWKILVGTPTSDKKGYCQDDFIANLKSFTYPHQSIIVDNSADRKNYKNILKEGIDARHIKPNNKSIYSVLAESHEEIRKHAIRNDFDYLLHLESDVFPPNNVIQRLLIHNLPIVSAMYMINFGYDSHLMAQDMEDFGKIRQTQNLKNGQDLMFINGDLKETFHCGLGCVLIRRDVLEKIEFRWEKGATIHPDGHFAFDTDALGYKKFIDTSILCEHRNREWKL
jgi:GT2 family glycosyltransferase